MCTWLGIECLVKTFNRGENEKFDVSDINEMLADNNKEEPILDDE